MEKKALKLHYFVTEYKSIKDTEVKKLIDETIAFTQRAYAPYSNFHVSAGALLSNGTIVKGANVENASYPVSICAERNLLANVVANHPNETIDKIVVYVDKMLPSPVPPCGLCRQTLIEVERRQKKSIALYMVAKNGSIIILESCRDLLPWSFDETFLD